MAGKGDSPKSCFSKEFKDNYDSIFWGGKSKIDELTTNLPDDLYWTTEKGVNLTQDCDNSSQFVAVTKQESSNIQKNSVGTKLSN